MRNVKLAERSLLIGTAFAGASLFLPSAALADCAASGSTVTCSGTAPSGYQTSSASTAVDVVSGATVGVYDTTPSPMLSVGSGSVLNNSGNVISTATAISLGGGSTLNNLDTGPATIAGDIAFGATTGTEVNTFNNFSSTNYALIGNVDSAGALTVNNTDSRIAGNVTSAGTLTFNNSGALIQGHVVGSDGDDVINNVQNNGVSGSMVGTIALGAGNDTVFNGDLSIIEDPIDLGSGDNVLTNDYAIIGSVTAGSGNDTINNNFRMAGNVDLGDGNNRINLDGGIWGNITAGNGDDSIIGDPAREAIFGNVDLGSGTDFIENIGGIGTVTKSGSGTLTLAGDNHVFVNTAGPVLNLNGGVVSIAAASNMLTGELAFDGGALQTTGALTLSNAITLNAGGGTFDAEADTSLSGVISGSGGITKTGAATLTLTADNSYSGATVVDEGVLVAAGTNSIGDVSAVTINSPAALQLSSDETIGSLAGDGTLSATIALTTGGNNASTNFSGALSGIVSITKVGTGTFTLAGTNSLANGIAIDEGTLAIGGAYLSPANSVADGATFNVLASGTLTGDVAGAAGSTLIINGSVAGNLANAGALSGTGTVFGAVTNSGTAAPGNNDIGVLSVDGSYSQASTGTLAVQLMGGAVPTAGVDFDQLAVSGTPGSAALGGTLALSLLNGVNGPFVNGATYDIVTATGGITGAFAAITGNVLSPFIELTPAGVVTLAGGTQAYRLTVARTSYAAGLGAGATHNEIAVANGIQNLLNGATGDAVDLVSRIDAMTSSEARTFFDQASPEPYGAYARALADQGDLFSRQLHLQMHETGSARSGFDIWMRGYDLWGNGRSSGFRVESDIDTHGIAGGVTYRWAKLFVGAALGGSKDKVDYALGNSSGRNKSWQAGLFGGWQSGSWNADLQMNYSRGSMTASRSIDVASVVRAANAKANGHQWSFVGTAGYGFDLAGLNVRPFVGADDTTGKLGAFTEVGAGAANLTVQSIGIRRLDGMLGLDLRSKPGSSFSLYGRVAYRHNFVEPRDRVTAYFNGDPSSAFIVSTVAAGRDEADIDAGVNYQATSRLAIFAGYQAAFRKDLTRQGISGGMALRF